MGVADSEPETRLVFRAQQWGSRIPSQKSLSFSEPKWGIVFRVAKTVRFPISELGSDSEPELGFLSEPEMGSESSLVLVPNLVHFRFMCVPKM